MPPFLKFLAIAELVVSKLFKTYFKIADTASCASYVFCVLTFEKKNMSDYNLLIKCYYISTRLY